METLEPPRDLIRKNARIEELEAQVASLEQFNDERVAEVEKLSRRPDLNPRQCRQVADAAEREWRARGYRGSLQGYERAMLAILQAAAGQED